MKILLADVCGFCFGVKRAVKIAQDAAKEYNNSVATFGELVHNPRVVFDLQKNGIACKHRLEDMSAGDVVIIRSHGVGPEVYKKAQEMGLKLIDATCPNVLKVQKAAANFAAEGSWVVVIGEKKHPEVASIKAWAGQNSSVVESLEDLRAVPLKNSYGVVSQTTFEAARLEKILNALQQQRPGRYCVEKTICMATSDRQNAARKLACAADVVIVLGGYSSANTRHLLEVVQESNLRAYQVENPDEITYDMLKDAKIIGITAGASTPQEIIKEAVVKMETMESLLAEESVRLHIGMVVEATVVAITKEEVIVDFGYQSEGTVAFDQWALGGTRETVAPEVNVGDKVTLKVIASENQDGLVVMSRIKAEADQAWNIIPVMLEESKVLPVKGLKAVKGGLTVAVAGVSGFIPASHLDLKRVEDISEYEGKEMQAEVLEFDPVKKRLVLSRRELLRQERAAASQAFREEKAAKLQARKEAEAEGLAALEVGTTLKGTVKSVVEFGLFVEIAPYLQGLVHVSELSWDRGVKPADLYKSGDEVEVFVKGVDVENGRISLSIKQLQEDPWQASVAEYNEGDIIVGKVVRFLPFGAIVELKNKIEGMVHISEIAANRIEKPEDVLTLGEEVSVKVLHIDPKHKKIGLSIIKAKQEAENAEMSQYMQQ